MTRNTNVAARHQGAAAQPRARRNNGQPSARHHRHKPSLDIARLRAQATAEGRLAQTNTLPSSRTPRFHAEMRALWHAVVTNRVGPALAAFFPETAYAQVKAVGDPQSDWEYRLVADLRVDLGAAHALLGSAPNSARLVDVLVPSTYAHWVPPGVCVNRMGYYELPNARLVYRENGAVRSFGIASMISWRGIWYVVHLGAVVRQAAVGVVDSPSAGPGTPAPSSTC